VQDLRPGTFSGLANLEYLSLDSNFIMVISALQPTSRSTRPFSVSSEICPHTWVLQNPPMAKGCVVEEDSWASSVRLFESDLIGSQDSLLAVRGSKSQRLVFRNIQ